MFFESTPGVPRFALTPGYPIPRLRRGVYGKAKKIHTRGSALRAHPWLPYSAPAARRVPGKLRKYTPGVPRFALTPGYPIPRLRRGACTGKAKKIHTRGSALRAHPWLPSSAPAALRLGERRLRYHQRKLARTIITVMIISSFAASARRLGWVGGSKG